MINNVVEFLNNTVRQYPENIAIEDGQNKITYETFYKESKTIADNIRHLYPFYCNKPIIIYLPKSYKSILAFIAVLYSGNIYVPIDEKSPKERILKICRNMKGSILISTNEYLSKDIYDLVNVLIYEDITIPNLKKLNDTDMQKQLSKTSITDPAYIIHTSGSSGTPKGVIITHLGIIDYVNFITSTFDINSSSVLGNQSPFYFDNSTFDIYACMATGAKLVIIPETLFMFPNKLPEYLYNNNIDVIFWVPTVIMNMANVIKYNRDCLKHLKLVIFCGEVMPNKQLNLWRSSLPNITYVNLYGPTEITDACTFYIVERQFLDNEPLPIGYPCPNTKIFILDGNSQVLQPMIVGEIRVSGPCLALGYYKNNDATLRTFVQNPLNKLYKELIYRTGDLGYFDIDGMLYYAGRIDSQIKHKGNRIELLEIELSIKSIEHINNACVMYDCKNQKIVAFIDSYKKFNIQVINRKLLELLPKYMLIHRIIELSPLPLTANGKVDRLKLKEFI